MTPRLRDVRLLEGQVSSPSPTGIGKNMDFGWMTAKEALLPSIIETESQTRTYAESKPGASLFLPTLSRTVQSLHHIMSEFPSLMFSRHVVWVSSAFKFQLGAN